MRRMSLSDSACWSSALVLSREAWSLVLSAELVALSNLALVSERIFLRMLIFSCLVVLKVMVDLELALMKLSMSEVPPLEMLVVDPLVEITLLIAVARSKNCIGC